MNLYTPYLRRAALALALGTVSVMPAAGQRALNLGPTPTTWCFTGRQQSAGYHSCFDISLTYAPVAAPSWTRTNVSVTLTNLQGSAQGGNTDWTGFRRVALSGVSHDPLSNFMDQHGIPAGNQYNNWGDVTQQVTSNGWTLDSYQSWNTWDGAPWTRSAFASWTGGNFYQSVGLGTSYTAIVGAGSTPQGLYNQVWHDSYTFSIDLAGQFRDGDLGVYVGGEFGAAGLAGRTPAPDGLGGNGFGDCFFDGTYDSDASWFQRAYPGGRTDKSPGYNACRAPSDVVPEPATIGLMATGLLGVVALGRRRRRGACSPS